MIKSILEQENEPRAAAATFESSDRLFDISKAETDAPEMSEPADKMSEPGSVIDFGAEDAQPETPVLSDWENLDRSESAPEEPQIIIAPFKPPSTVEAIRRSGLAWSAGVIFFGSVAFMLILGWFADLLFGSAPWGLVGGIVLGSIIGFVNFFRITSQIFRS